MIANVWLRSLKAAMPAVRRAHPDDDVRGWIRDVLVPAGTVSVVEVNTTVVGLLALASGWIEQLYVDPDWQRRGIDARLVGLAKRQEPSGLQLWTFQINRRAQQFYERHGFAAVEWTDGSANEEREPTSATCGRGEWPEVWVMPALASLPWAARSTVTTTARAVAGAPAGQPNSRRCSSCVRPVKRVFSMHASLRPTRPSSSAMATMPSMQSTG